MTKYVKRKMKYYIQETIFHAGVLILAFVMLYPILWMISNSFKTNREIFNSFSLVPSVFSLDNYIRGWKYNGTISFG
ncbi:MAG: carbohydrate ABC transporter permease, partial [Treponema sp.]|nr:carbohydrate ABC transporter permease [Treponema sp.]